MTSTPASRPRTNWPRLRRHLWMAVALCAALRVFNLIIFGDHAPDLTVELAVVALFGVLFMKARKLAVAALTAAAIITPLAAHDYSVGTIQIDHPWARVTAAGQSAGGGFMTLTNRGRRADVLIGGSTPVAREVQVHEMAVTDGVMRMRQLTGGLTIPAGGSVQLRPGSYHVMFMGLNRALVAGERVPVTLRFQRAGSVRVEFAVEAMGATPGGDHAH